jgi:Skp family chaperone for outer membrane proteins
VGGLTVGPWDANNHIRVVGATLGVVGAVGMLFDTFYRRATKQELNQAMEKFDAKIDKLDAKIDREMGKLDAKIDGLTNALLHTNQRDKIAAETENRELRRENERLKAVKI